MSARTTRQRLMAGLPLKRGVSAAPVAASSVVTGTRAVLSAEGRYWRVASRPTAPNGLEYDIKMTMSTEEMAADAGVILASSWDLSAYETNPVVILYHDYRSLPVAKAVDIRVEGSTLVGYLLFDEDDDLAVRVRNKFLRGFMFAGSVGFLVRGRRASYEGTLTTADRQKWGPELEWVAIDTVLREFSLVPVPSDENATLDLDAPTAELPEADFFPGSINVIAGERAGGTESAAPETETREAAPTDPAADTPAAQAGESEGASETAREADAVEAPDAEPAASEPAPEAPPADADTTTPEASAPAADAPNDATVSEPAATPDATPAEATEPADVAPTSEAPSAAVDPATTDAHDAPASPETVTDSSAIRREALVRLIALEVAARLEAARRTTRTAHPTTPLT